MSPTARTLALLRKLGYLAEVVERFLPRMNRKRDLFGIADCLGFHMRDGGAILVQATTLAHLPDRLRRIRARPERLPALLKAGCRVEVWGWDRRGERWQVKRVVVTAADVAVVQDVRSRRRLKGERQGLLFAVTGTPAERANGRKTGLESTEA